MVAFESYGTRSRPWKALLRGYEKFVWDQTKRFCKEQNFPSIPRWNMFCSASGSQACGCSFHTRQPNNWYVVSTFGLCTGLLRQREFPTEGFLNSEKINLVVDAVNGIAIDSGMRVSYGGKTFHSNDELQKIQTRIAEAEHEMLQLEKSNEYLNSFLPSSPPIATSSPSCSSKYCSIDSLNNSSSSTSNNASCGSNCESSISNASVIEETLNGFLGPTLKKKKVVSECRKVSAFVDGELAKYHETLACVLGNSFL